MNIKNSAASGSVRVSPARTVQLSTELRLRLADLVGAAADQVSLSSFSAALQASESNSPQQTARLAELSAASRSSSRSTTRMPLPPPPADALSKTG